jgi:hypothetical protein
MTFDNPIRRTQKENKCNINVFLARELRVKRFIIDTWRADIAKV